MKNLTATICLTITLLLGSVGASWSADWNKGLTAFKSADYATALREWTPLADKGNARAQNAMGSMYTHGLGVPKDDNTAVKWYRLSAENGEKRGQFSLGLMYAMGKGVPLDLKTALKWWTLAAKQGYARAQTGLGMMYEDGDVGPKDYKTAVKWYTLAAKQGFANAQTGLDRLQKKIAVKNKLRELQAHAKQGNASAREKQEEAERADGNKKYLKKVYWSIIKAENFYREDIIKDEFDEFEHYLHFAGCKYTYLVNNQTDHKIKISMAPTIHAKLGTKQPGLSEMSTVCGKFKVCNILVNASFEEIIRPNSKIEFDHVGIYKTNPAKPLEGILSIIGKSKRKYTNEEIEKAKVKFGCESQKGKIYLTKNHPMFGAKSLVIFSKKTGISPDQSYNYIEFDDGVYPLKRGF